MLKFIRSAIVLGWQSPSCMSKIHIAEIIKCIHKWAFARIDYSIYTAAQISTWPAATNHGASDGCYSCVWPKHHWASRGCKAVRQSIELWALRLIWRPCSILNLNWFNPYSWLCNAVIFHHSGSGCMGVGDAQGSRARGPVSATLRLSNLA